MLNLETAKQWIANYYPEKADEIISWCSRIYGDKAIMITAAIGRQAVEDININKPDVWFVELDHDKTPLIQADALHLLMNSTVYNDDLQIVLNKMLEATGENYLRDKINALVQSLQKADVLTVCDLQDFRYDSSTSIVWDRFIAHSIITDGEYVTEHGTLPAGDYIIVYFEATNTPVLLSGYIADVICSIVTVKCTNRDCGVEYEVDADGYGFTSNDYFKHRLTDFEPIEEEEYVNSEAEWKPYDGTTRPSHRLVNSKTNKVFCPFCGSEMIIY